jgi:hypothetical protein
VLTTTISIISSVLDALILSIFLNQSLQRKKGRLTAVFYTLSLIMVEVILSVETYVFSGIYSFQKILIVTLISIATTFCLTLFFNNTVFMRIFTAIIFQTLTGIAEYLTVLLLSHIKPEIYVNVTFFTDILTDFLTKIITFFFVVVISLVWHPQKHTITFKYAVISLATPLITIILLCSFPTEALKQNTTGIICLFALVALLFMNIINFILINNVIDSLTLTERLNHIEQQTTYQTENFARLSASYRNMRRLLHDTKKHNFYMQSCIKSENYDELYSYLTESIKDLESIYIRVNTGNLVIDTLLTNYINICEERQISFDYKLNIIEHKIPVSDYDLTIILGNLLDNSYNASVKLLENEVSEIPPEISIGIASKGKHFVIHTENNYIKPSVKASRNTFSHGYGTENIRQVTEKYCGTYLAEYEDTLYAATVIIPID